MGIKDRIEAAKILIANNLHNDALILVLVAIAASSRKQFPKNIIKLDGEAFISFLKIGIKEILWKGNNGNVDYLDHLKLHYNPSNRPLKRHEHSIEELIYEQYRCAFLHEAKLSDDVLFTSESISGREVILVTLYDDSVAHLGVTHEEVLVMSLNWLDVLIKVVEQARINIDLFEPAPPRIDNGEPKAIFTNLKAS